MKTRIDSPARVPHDRGIWRPIILKRVQSTRGRQPDTATGSVVVPIYQTATSAQEEVGQHKLCGAKTLALRMERDSANAMALAQMLAQHPAIEQVMVPGLDSHPQHAVAARQTRLFDPYIRWD